MTSNLDPASREAAHVAYETFGQAGHLRRTRLPDVILDAIIHAYLDTLSHAGEGEPVQALERFDLFTDGWGDELIGLRNRPDGDWVKFADVVALYATPRPDTAEGERDGFRAGLEVAAKYVEGYSDAQLMDYVAKGIRALSKPAPQAEGVSEAEVELEAARMFGGGYFAKIVAESTRDHYRGRARRALARPVDKGEGAPE